MQAAETLRCGTAMQWRGLESNCLILIWVNCQFHTFCTLWWNSNGRLTLGWILPMDNCNHFPYNNIYRNDTRLWLVHFSAINRPSDSCNFVRFWKTHVCMFFPHCTRNHTITHTNRTVKAFHVLKYRQDTQGVTALGFVAKSMWKPKEQRCMPLIAKFNSKTVGECHKAMGT